ncbi:MAG: hypothetical protein DI529_03355 [Chryseobacterium sp.]|nr:MAG: hypothetical protein DI529_03355 [Chryseobacterium sp.]
MKILKYNLSIIAFFMSLSIFGQQSKKMTDKFFPDPDIEMNTPSFSKKGIAGYKEMMGFINEKISGKDNVSLSYIGKTQKDVDIPTIIFKSDAPKVKVMFSARIHGDEPAGTEGLLLLIDKLLSDPELQALRKNMDIAILPMVNIDGGERMDRRTSNGLDLNRDLTKLETPESVVFREFLNKFSPDVYIDFHEYNPFRADYLKMETSGVSGFADVMFLYCENPNYPKSLSGLFAEKFLPEYQSALKANNLTYYKYFAPSKVKGEIVLNIGAASPRSTSSGVGLTNALSMLIEVRGEGMEKISFRRRTYTSFLIALTTLKESLKNSDLIKEKVKEAANTFNDIVVTEKRKTEVRKIPFIDIGKNELVEIEMPVRDVSDRTPDIVRKRPEYYAILPQYETVANKLIQLGLKVEKLDEEKMVNAESYHIKDVQKSNTKFEGFYEQIVTTEIKEQQVKLPKGTFLINMRQKNSNLAAVVLEPEAENGFVRYNVFSIENLTELPIYRIIK